MNETTTTIPSPPSTVRELMRLARYARRWRGRVLAATACSVTNKVLDLAPPALIGAAIDVVVKREDSFLARFGPTEVMSQLTLLAVLTFVIWGLESLFEYAFQVLWRNLAQDIQHTLRVEAWEHLQTIELAYFEERTSGELMAVLNDDVNQLERFLDGGANDLLQVSTTVVVVGATFFAASPTLALMAFVPVPVVLWGSFRYQDRLAPRYREVRERVGALSAALANSLGGLATVRSYVAGAREVETIRGLSAAYVDANRDAIRTSSAFSPLIRMVIVVGFTATIVYGGWLADTGVLEVGVYGLLVFLTQRLLWPLTRLGQTFDLYQRAMASTRRILDLLEVRALETSGGASLDGRAGDLDLVFDDVRFSYPSRPHVLTGLRLQIPARRTTAIVGATGSGKSTVVKLLLRFHDPTTGAIRLGDRTLDAWDLNELRRAIGLVSQDVYIFHGTVRDNIRYGDPDASEEAVRRAATLAEATEFIEALPEGWDTVVGERGQKLSGGQRQRISIARALLKDPPILVLDEATSAVDNETEAAIQRSLDRVSKDRTTVLIAHRLSTVRHADCIWVLDGGRVIESGTHEALVAAGGAYARLWRVQTGERDAERAGAAEASGPGTSAATTHHEGDGA